MTLEGCQREWVCFQHRRLICSKRVAQVIQHERDGRVTRLRVSAGLLEFRFPRCRGVTTRAIVTVVQFCNVVAGIALTGEEPRTFSLQSCGEDFQDFRCEVQDRLRSTTLPS